MGFFKRKKTNKQYDFENFPPIGGLMVSKMITIDKKKPSFMYREKRSRPEDSGWRIFSGYESDEYANNPDNIGIYNPSTILNLDPSIADLLLFGVGSVFERESGKSEWYKVNDFNLVDDYMVKLPISKKWFIEINNLFELNNEDENIVYLTTGDKSERISVWDNDRLTKKEIYEEQKLMIKNRDQTNSKTLEIFDFSDSYILRLGYMIKESGDRKRYDVIYAFSIIDYQFLRIALYFDDNNDKKWAIDTWKNIKIKK